MYVCYEIRLLLYIFFNKSILEHKSNIFNNGNKVRITLAGCILFRFCIQTIRRVLIPRYILCPII